MDLGFEGWFKDPFGRHEMRWMSDGMPTDLVRDAGTESHDQPPGESRPGSQPSPNEPLPSILPLDWTGLKMAAPETLLAQAKTEWFRFPDLRGEHLFYQKTGRNSWAWRNGTTGEIEMTSHYNRFYFGPKPTSISYQGRTYGWQRVGRRKVLAVSRIRQSWDLIDLTTKSPLLRKNGRHLEGMHSAEIELGRTVYSFPVIGESSTQAVMAAIDGTGKPVLEYRCISYSMLDIVEHRDVTYERSITEIVIPPESLTIPDIYVLVAVTSRFIIDFFETWVSA